MKKIIYSLAIIATGLCSSAAIGQTIPNGDFETWESVSRDTLTDWKGTIGVQKITGKGGVGFAAKVVTTTQSDIASLVSGNISCVSNCSGQVKGVGIPLDGKTGLITIKADFASSQNGAVVAMAFFDKDGVVMDGGVSGYYVAPLSASQTFTTSTVSVFITSATPTFGTVTVPTGAVEVILAFFPEASDPNKLNSKTIGSYVSVDNLSVLVGGKALTIPNAGFENWTNINTDKATGWTSSETYMTGSLFKSNESNTGATAAKIVTGSFVGNIQTGVLSLGSVQYGANQGDEKYFPVFALSKVPSFLKFSSKYVPAIGVSDSAAVEVILTKKVLGVTTKVGSGYKLIAPSPSYTSVQLPITLYPGETAADSAIIIFTSSRGKGTVNRGLGSTLWVDDVSFSDGTDAIAVDYLTNNVVVAPNPSNGFVQISNLTNTLVSVKIRDASSKLVASQLLIENQKSNIDLSNLPKGLYFVEIKSGVAVSIKKLIVE